MPSIALTILVLISSSRSRLRPTNDGRYDMWPSTYLRTSCSLARISNDVLPLNFSVISGMNLEVAKTFTPHLAWRLKISDRNIDRQPYDAWHSSSASIIMKIFEYKVLMV